MTSGRLFDDARFDIIDPATTRADKGAATAFAVGGGELS
jgi:hypothetical protein